MTEILIVKVKNAVERSRRQESVKPLVDMDSYIDTAQQLVVCGDYFGTRHGRVEGAFQSGRSAAQKLIRQIMNNESNEK